MVGVRLRLLYVGKGISRTTTKRRNGVSFYLLFSSRAAPDLYRIAYSAFPTSPSLQPMAHSPWPTAPGQQPLSCSPWPAAPGLQPLACSPWPTAPGQHSCPGLQPLAYSPWPAAPGLQPLACSPWPTAPGLQPLACSPWPTAPGLQPLAYSPLRCAACSTQPGFFRCYFSLAPSHESKGWSQFSLTFTVEDPIVTIYLQQVIYRSIYSRSFIGLSTTGYL